jgi:hypothetical protein
MSPRTGKYVEAMVREDFDYDKWLKKVREEEAQAKQIEATGISGELAVARMDKLKSTRDDQYTPSHPALGLTPQTIRVRGALLQLRQAESQTPKTRLRRWLEKVRRAWGEFQGSRRRDGVYRYLESVFAIVEHYRVRRRTHRLLRHAYKFADRPFDKNADAFSTIIRFTCDNGLDVKTISKYARALRYASRHKEPDTRLKRFMKEAGGVNQCASLYAKQLGRNNRVAAI